MRMGEVSEEGPGEVGEGSRGRGTDSRPAPRKTDVTTPTCFYEGWEGRGGGLEEGRGG